MTDKQIDERPEILKINEVNTGIIEYKGEEHLYTVVNKEMKGWKSKIIPTAPNFVGFFNLEHLFISESVPEDYREYFMLNKLFEFTYLASVKGRNVSALKKELDLVPQKIKKSYQMFRQIFFEENLEFYKHSRDEISNIKMKQNLDYLVNLNNQ